MFKQGDKVLYPLHGGGVIKGIENKDNGFGLRPFYVVTLINSGMTVYIPVLTAKQSGLRMVAEPGAFETVFSKMSTLELENEPNWNKRYRRNLEYLREGDIEKTAAVFREQYMRNEIKTLSAGERKIYTSARHMLITEIMLSYNIEKDRAEEMLFKAIGV